MKKRYFFIALILLSVIGIYLLVRRQCGSSSQQYSIAYNDISPRDLQITKNDIFKGSKNQLLLKSIKVEKPNLDDLPIEYPSIANMINDSYSFQLHEHIASHSDVFNNSSISFPRPALIEYLPNTVLLAGYDIYRTLEKPFYWGADDFYKLALITAGTAFLTRIDNQFNNELISNRSITDKPLFEAAEFYGRNTTLIFSALGFTATGIIIDDPEISIMGVELLESFLIVETLSNLLKNSFGRSRPYLNVGSDIYNMFDPIDNSQKSFPSGHTIMAFTISSVISSHIKNPWLKTAVFIPAMLTGVQRMYSQNHWASDVFLGAAIGYFIGQSITSLHGYNEKERVLFSTNSRGEFGLVIPLD